MNKIPLALLALFFLVKNDGSVVGKAVSPLSAGSGETCISQEVSDDIAETSIKYLKYENGEIVKKLPSEIETIDSEEETKKIVEEKIQKAIRDQAVAEVEKTATAEEQIQINKIK